MNPWGIPRGAYAASVLRLVPLLALPILELWILLELGGVLGAWPVVAWCLATMLVGLWLLRRQAESLARVLRTAREVGPSAPIELGRQARFGFAGVALAFPGVLTDVLALALIVSALRLPRQARTPPRSDGPRGGAGTGSGDVEIIPPGRIASPFRKRPKVIDVD